MHPEQADSPFQRLDYLHSYSTRSVSNNNLFIPRGKTNNFQKNIAFAGSKKWNEIPKEIRMAQTLHSSGTSEETLCRTAGTVIMTHWFALLAEVWGTFITWEVAPNRDGWGCCLEDGGFGFLLISWSLG